MRRACGGLELTLSSWHLDHCLLAARLLNSGGCSVGILLESRESSAAVQLAFC